MSQGDADHFIFENEPSRAEAGDRLNRHLCGLSHVEQITYVT
jgi:hypothetical protein